MCCTDIRSCASAFLHVAGTSLILVGSLGAPSQDSIRVGARVILASADSACGSRWKSCNHAAFVIGVIARLSTDTVVIQFGPTATVAIPRERNQNFLVSQGRSRLRSALQVAAMNGLLAFWIADFTDASRRSKVITGSGVVASGFVVGALFPSERWRRVLPPEAPH